MKDHPPTPVREAEAQRLAALIPEKTKEETPRIARLMVGRADHEPPGATEFEVRDRVHRVGALAREAALNGRKKGGVTARASSARTAGRRRDSTNTGTKDS